MQTPVNKGFSFGDFEIDAGKRLLLKAGKIVNLNPKAFELLSVLVENHGKVLTKNELLDAVWTDQFVEENNLTVHVAALRKALGEKKDEHRFIVTIPGRGYSFVAKVQRAGIEHSAETFENTESQISALQSNSNHSVASENYQNGWRHSLADDSLIGREREVAEIKNLLRVAETRLITLTGTGGTGKTRLAQAVAGESAGDFPDGVFFIELAAVSSADLAASEIAQSLGVKETGEKSLCEALKNFLRERRILLVLDNFEQVLSAASLIKEISASSSRLKILITSRAALQLNIEREFVVAPLAVPPRENFSIDKLNDYAAVSLFVERARTAKPSFVLTIENAPFVAGICYKLDGLPLAVELAAARVKLLSPQAILARLENSLKLLTSGAKNLPARQRTMRETIQWSYDLLDEDEKILFRRLAVFAGGLTVEAAEAVAGGDAEIGRRGDTKTKVELPNPALQIKETEISSTSGLSVAIPQINVLDLLTSLIDNNLLTLKEQADGSVRLRMLEVVREFAFELLQASGEQNFLQQNHAEFFLELAEEAEPYLLGEQSVEWLEKLENEHENLRAALRWSLEQKPATAARLAAALRYFWSNHSHLIEGRGWLEAALKQRDEIPLDASFKLLTGLGQFARNQGDYETARTVYEEGLAQSRTINDFPQIIRFIHGLAALATRQGDFAAAEKFTEEQLALARRLGDESGIAFALSSLGDIKLAKGESAAARPLLEESLAISRKLGNKQILSINLVNIGVAAYNEGDFDAASRYFAEALNIADELGNKTIISCSLDGFAALAAASGESEKAAQLAGAAENVRRSIGYEIEPAERLFCQTYAAKIHAALDEKSFIAAYEQGQFLSLNEAVSLAKITVRAVDEQTTEIIVETHKFERVVIEEEVENDAPDEIEVPQTRLLHAAPNKRKKVGKRSSRTPFKSCD